jgi:uncharacterized protein
VARAQPLQVQAANEFWVQQESLRSFPLERGWRAYYNPNGPLGVAALNSEAQRVLSAFSSPISPVQIPDQFPQLPDYTVRHAVRNLARSGLVRPAVTQVAPRLRASSLSAWLHVTEACNLHCPYCYVRKSPKTMSLEVGARAIDTLVDTATRHRYSTIKLKYAGGEPTLRFSLVQALHYRALRRALEARLTLDEVILTNGIGITNSMLDFIARTGMRLMVSLDGGPATQNRVRPRGRGQDSYGSVYGTVARALRLGIRPTVSVTLTRLSLGGASEAVAFALEQGLPFNLNFYRECTLTPPGKAAQSMVPDTALLQETVMEILDLVAAFPSYPLSLTGILDRTRLDIPHHYPCSAGRDYLAVDTQGNVSACQMLLEEPWADLSAGDPLAQVRAQGRELFESVDNRAECDNCPWRTACSGGCPLMRDSALHDEYCQVYQALFPKLIKLEATRLIAAQAGLH